MIALYMLAQCTWGLLQSLLGGVLLLLHARERHFLYHGALITIWRAKSSMSLGMFVFLTDDPSFERARYSKEECAARLLVHEYGHTIQSLLFGPLYLLLVGIPSSLWGFLPAARRKRREQGVSYFTFITERSANRLGEWATGEQAPE